MADTRRYRGLTALELAERTVALGYPITRSAIARIEGNHRAGKLDLAELVTLAAALQVPPVQLLYPAVADGAVDVLPLTTVASDEAAAWFAGQTAPAQLPTDTALTAAAEERRRLRDRLDEIDRPSVAEYAAITDTIAARIDHLDAAIVEGGGIVRRLWSV